MEETPKKVAVVDDLLKMGFSRKRLGLKSNKYRPAVKRTVPLGFKKTNHHGYIQDSGGTLYYTEHHCGGLISNKPKLTKAEKKAIKRQRREK